MDTIEKAAEVLRLGGVIAYPTDTVYGLGANIFDEQAIMRVIELKRRPIGKPISVAVSGIKMLENIAHLSEENRKITELLLPGPVTLILPAKDVVSPLLTGNLGKIGVRWVESPLIDKLLGFTKFPITATSANLAGGSDVTCPKDLEVVPDFVIGGDCPGGTPSTVVDLVEKRILREGAGMENVRAALKGKF